MKVCRLVERDEEKYINKTLEDINYLIETEDLMAKEYQHTQLQSEVNLINQIDEIVKTSTQKTTEEQNKNISKSQKVKSISNNRYYEKEQRRVHEKFDLTEPTQLEERIEESEDKSSTSETVSLNFQESPLKN